MKFFAPPCTPEASGIQDRMKIGIQNIGDVIYGGSPSIALSERGVTDALGRREEPSRVCLQSQWPHGLRNSLLVLELGFDYELLDRSGPRLRRPAQHEGRRLGASEGALKAYVIEPPTPGIR